MSVFRVIVALVAALALGGCRVNHSRVHAGLSDAKIESRLEHALRDAQSWDEVLERVSRQLDWEAFDGPRTWGYSPVFRHDEASRSVEVPLSDPHTSGLMSTGFPILESAEVQINPDGQVAVLERGPWDRQQVVVEGHAAYRNDWPEMPAEDLEDWGQYFTPIALAKPDGDLRFELSFDWSDSDALQERQFLYVVPGVPATEQLGVSLATDGTVEDVKVIGLGSRRPAEAGAYILHHRDERRVRSDWDDTRLRFVPDTESGYLIKVRAQPQTALEVVVDPPQRVETPNGGGS